MKVIREHIGFADDSMVPELMELWMEAFGDEREYVEFYFNNRFREGELLVYVEEGRPVSMLSLLPVILHIGEDKIPARYVYAVATAKAYRGRGYAGTLIQEAGTYLKEPLLLQPADESLVEYYRKMGFREAFTLWECEPEKPTGAGGVTAQQLPERARKVTAGSLHKEQRYWLLTITPTEYATLRNQYFAKEGYIEWDRDAIAYALLENEFQGGYAYKVYHDGQEDILLYRMENGCMKIIETTLSDADIYGVLEKLRMEPEKILVRRPAGKNEKRVLGMLWSDHPVQGGYLNLTLD